MVPPSSHWTIPFKVPGHCPPTLLRRQVGSPKEPHISSKMAILLSDFMSPEYWNPIVKYKNWKGLGAGTPPVLCILLQAGILVLSQHLKVMGHEMGCVVPLLEKNADLQSCLFPVR